MTKISDMRGQVVALVNTGMPDREIMAALGISKNVVIGHRHRAGITSNRDPSSAGSMRWRPKLQDEPQTLFDRMDALEARMKAALAECVDRPSHHAKLPAATGKAFVVETPKGR